MFASRTLKMKFVIVTSLSCNKNVEVILLVPQDVMQLNSLLMHLMYQFYKELQLNHYL